MVCRAGLASYEKNMVPLTGLERYLGHLVHGTSTVPTAVRSFLGRITDDLYRSSCSFTEFLEKILNRHFHMHSVFNSFTKTKN